MMKKKKKEKGEGEKRKKKKEKKKKESAEDNGCTGLCNQSPAIISLNRPGAGPLFAPYRVAPGNRMTSC